jgi:hypothetical protein
MVKMVKMSILLRLIYCSDKAKTGIYNDELYEVDKKKTEV